MAKNEINHPLWPLLHRELPEEVKEFLINKPMTDAEDAEAAQIANDRLAQGHANILLRLLENAKTNYPSPPSWAVGTGVGYAHLALISIVTLIYPKSEIQKTMSDWKYTPQPYPEIKDVAFLLAAQTAIRSLYLIRYGFKLSKEEGIEFLLGKLGKQGFKQFENLRGGLAFELEERDEALMRIAQEIISKQPKIKNAELKRKVNRTALERGEIEQELSLRQLARILGLEKKKKKS